MTPYKPYFGDDASTYASVSPIPGLLQTSVPLMIAWTGLDPVGIQADAMKLEAALCKAEKCPTKIVLRTHNHVLLPVSIGTSDTELTDQLIAFMKHRKTTN
jgi:hypothetical protein